MSENRILCMVILLKIYNNNLFLTFKIRKILKFEIAVIPVIPGFQSSSALKYFITKRGILRGMQCFNKVKLCQY